MNEKEAGDEKAPRPKIVILSASLGAGHNQAAKAIVEALEDSSPGPGVKVVDSLDYASWIFRRFYAGTFVLGMTKIPRLWGWGYRASDHPQTPGRSRGELARLSWERRSLRNLGDLLVRWSPEIVINTHFLATPLVAHLIRSGSLAARQAVVVTDHEVHRWWYSEGVDHWFVPGDADAARICKWGIDKEKVTVCDIPVRLKWTQEVDRAKALADWKLPPGRPIVLLSGGTEFTCGPVEAIATGILRASASAHVVVMAGRNKDLLARLSGHGEAGRRLTPVSFTDRAHELVALASLMVTKPGGVTTAECCAMGTPMVLLRPVPGQESCNADYLSAHGAAVTPGGSLKVIEAVRRLLESPGELAAMADAARKLHRPAAQPIAGKVIEWLSLSEKLSSPART